MLSLDRPVLCFGEMLWDSLPDGMFPGGAPMNVAFHLHRQGADARIISAVGADVLGEELLRRLRYWELPADGVAVLPGDCTGLVRAEIDPAGVASYNILRDVAWDAIPVTPPIEEMARRSQMLIYGSLAQRSPVNRAALDRLRKLLPPDAMIVFDVNLRSPFDDKDLVAELARGAHLLKLNHEEAAHLAGSSENGKPQRSAEILAERWNLSRICITCGAGGAGFWSEGQWIFEAARAVEVVDTVGAGDAFLASLLIGLMQGHAPSAALSQACRVAEQVVSRRGATPKI